MLSCSFRPGYWRHNSSGFAFFAWQVGKQRAFLGLSLSFKSRWRGGEDLFRDDRTEERNGGGGKGKTENVWESLGSVRLAELSWSLA